ncbi:DUF6544 family protein [Pseudidiomarina sp.]|uniref:DUF6544 family protein n=1 Tax=Pseudidiomarina sp. TaxID=2081707 RepID=UPI003A96B441
MIWISTLIIVFIVLLVVLRGFDCYLDRKERRRLIDFQPNFPEKFSSQLVSDMPEPVRRFFNYMILPDAPLKTVAQISMAGEFSLGTPQHPNSQKMQAEQVLAAPEGFLWSVRLGGALMVSGSDSARWTRFRILGLIPVARLGGDVDHQRAAFGRYIAEAVFWSPASLLPAADVIWSARSDDCIRVHVRHSNVEQCADVHIHKNGQPHRVEFLRWSNANPTKEYQLQPFGGTLSDFREVQGFRVPFYVEAANMLGTDEEFVFFKAHVNSIRW